jgi:hypothetical protein
MLVLVVLDGADDTGRRTAMAMELTGALARTDETVVRLFLTGEAARAAITMPCIGRRPAAPVAGVRHGTQADRRAGPGTDGGCLRRSSAGLTFHHQSVSIFTGYW